MGWECEVFVVGQTVVNSPVGKGILLDKNLLNVNLDVFKHHLSHLLALITEAKMRSLIEEHTDALVGELVSKTVLVGVVDPFCDPKEGLRPGQAGRVSSSWGEGESENIGLLLLLFRVHKSASYKRH